MAKIKKTVEELEELLPEEPVYFRKWAENQAPIVPIYYRRTKKGADCWCGKCNQGYYTEDKPERHSMGQCPICGHKGVYEWKKVTRASWYEDHVILVQRTTDNNLVIRYFEIWQKFQQGIEADTKIREQSRYFLTLGEAYRMDNIYHYYRGIAMWEMTEYKRIYEGAIFPGYRTEVKESNFKYCDIDAIADCCRYTSANRGTDVSRMLITFARNAAVEMYCKAGMKNIVSYILDGCGKRQFVNRKADTPLKQLRITRQQLNRLREKNGDVYLLQAMQLSKKRKLNWSEKEEEIAAEVIRQKNMAVLDFFMQYMSLRKLSNRIEKYMQEKNSYGRHSTIVRYYDYLVMRKEFGFDMTNEVYLFPNNLIAKHQEMIDEGNRRKDGQRKAKKNAEFSKIAENFKKLDKKYHYEADNLFIRPANSAGEIIDEGRTLHHCVGSSDTYMKRHNDGYSFILFLRRVEEPDEPYYTIELGKDGKIRQWYSKNDKKPDKELIEAWLNKWLKTISKVKKLKAAV